MRTVRSSGRRGVCVSQLGLPRGGCLPQCMLGYTSLWTEWLTDNRKNITFPQLRTYCICWSDSMSSVCAPYLQIGLPMFVDFFKQWKISKTTWILAVFFVKAYFPLILQSLRTSSRHSFEFISGIYVWKVKAFDRQTSLLKTFRFFHTRKQQALQRRSDRQEKRTICSSFPSLVTNTFNKQCGLGWHVLVVSPRAMLHYHCRLVRPIRECLGWHVLLVSPRAMLHHYCQLVRPIRECLGWHVLVVSPRAMLHYHCRLVRPIRECLGWHVLGVSPRAMLHYHCRLVRPIRECLGWHVLGVSPRAMLHYHCRLVRPIRECLGWHVLGVSPRAMLHYHCRLVRPIRECLGWHVLGVSPQAMLHYHCRLVRPIRECLGWRVTWCRPILLGQCYTITVGSSVLSESV